MRRFHFAWLGLVLLVVQPLLAKTYYVGSCKTGAFSTIGAAVAAVPAGSTIDVCPGTYPEQVVIAQPLTLQAIASGGSSQAVIAMPASGLTTTSSVRFGTVAAQVEVTAGPVNITGISVDGTASSSNCPAVQDVGIFYASGSSGTLNEVETRYQSCNSAGIGIFAENGSEVTTSVTIENSNANLSSWADIYVCSPQPSTLNATIKNNYIIVNNGYGIATDCNTTATISGNVVYANYAISGIELIAPSSTVTGNAVTGGDSGIRLDVAGVRVSGNTVIGASFGITVNAAGSVISNHIGNSDFGISLAGSGATVQTNVITQGQIGIEFQCVTATVSGNTINGPATGFDQFPGTSTGTNKFYNVATLTTGCS
jgi:hypothetical protein